jgi:hypothetical protein
MPIIKIEHIVSCSSEDPVSVICFFEKCTLKMTAT